MSVQIALMASVANLLCTYDFGLLLKSEEQEFLLIIDGGVSVRTACLLLAIIVGRFPLNLALNFTLEESRDACRHESHLNVEVAVGLQLSRHGFQAQIVTAKT